MKFNAVEKYLVFLLVAAFSICMLFSCKKEKSSPSTEENPTSDPNPIPIDPGELVGVYKYIYVDSVNVDSVSGNAKNFLKVKVSKNKFYTVSLIQCNNYKVKIKASFSQNLAYNIYNGNGGDTIRPTEFVFNATDTTLFLKVSGESISNVKFKLMVHEFPDTTNQVNMGVWAFPTPTAASWVGTKVHIGTVDTRGVSYFEISGLPMNKQHWVTLYSMTADADMNICIDNTFSQPFLPSTKHNDVLSTAEEYKYNADLNGKIYIKVYCGELNRLGSTFRLLVKPVD